MPRRQLSKIALFVREKRRHLGYTQPEFSARVGVSLGFLRALEQGKASLRLDKVHQVLDFLGYELVPQPIEKKSQ